jgi:peptide/nickel transport system permease protein
MSKGAKRVLHSLMVRIIIVTAFVGVSGIVCATLVRLAPGSSVDERELDARLSGESLRAVRSERDSERNIAIFYARYLTGLLRADFGSSRLFSQPINQLIRDRAPTSARNTIYGLGMAWTLALLFAFAAVVFQRQATDFVLSICAGALIAVPTAVIALFVMNARKPVSIAVAIALIPVLYRYSRNILQQSWLAPWMTAARAKGLGSTQLLFRHALPVAAPQLIALAAVSLNLAFSAVLPIEVVADSPGIGQLAWQAAMGRDLPLLITVTVLLTTITLLADAASAVINEAIHPAKT